MTPALLLDPFGPIQKAWFADDKEFLPERLQVYIDDASTRPELANADDPEAAIVRWVEYRAYTFLRMQSVETIGVKSITLNDQGTVTLGDKESRGGFWDRRAADALRSWRLLTAEPIPIRDAATGCVIGSSWAAPEEGS